MRRYLKFRLNNLFRLFLLYCLDILQYYDSAKVLARSFVRRIIPPPLENEQMRHTYSLSLFLPLSRSMTCR
jgi:hypothetical protein